MPEASNHEEPHIVRFAKSEVSDAESVEAEHVIGVERHDKQREGSNRPGGSCLWEGMLPLRSHW